MAISGKEHPTAIPLGLKANLSDMRAGFRKELADCRRSFQTVVKNAREERSTFVSGLKEVVANMRQELASEMAASRLAWLGITGVEGHSPLRRSLRGSRLNGRMSTGSPSRSAEEFVEFRPAREAGPDAVVLEAGREEMDLIAAAKQLPGREEKRTSKRKNATSETATESLQGAAVTETSEMVVEPKERLRFGVLSAAAGAGTLSASCHGSPPVVSAEAAALSVCRSLTRVARTAAARALSKLSLARFAGGKELWRSSPAQPGNVRSAPAPATTAPPPRWHA